MSKLRVFLAAFPNRFYQREIWSELNTFSRQFKGVHFGKHNSFHLTFKFLGDMQYEDVTVISRALKERLEIYRCKVKFGRYGCFPSPENARVFFLSLEDENKRLAGIAEEIDLLMEEQGFPREKRPFAAHVTVARCKGNVPAEAGKLLELDSKMQGVTWPIETVDIVESRLGKEGPTYTVLDSISIY